MLGPPQESLILKICHGVCKYCYLHPIHCGINHTLAQIILITQFSIWSDGLLFKRIKFRRLVAINIVFILLPCFFFSSPSDKVSLEYRLPIISWNTSSDLPILYFLYAIPGSTVRISFAKLLNKWWVKICFN